MKNIFLKLMFLLTVFLFFNGCGIAGDKEYRQERATLVIENKLSKNIIAKYKVFSGEIFSIWQGPNDSQFPEQRVSDKEEIIPANESRTLNMAWSQGPSSQAPSYYNKTITIRDDVGKLKEFNIESNAFFDNRRLLDTAGNWYTDTTTIAEDIKLIIDSNNFN
ncbi:MAG: hypothetical protein PHX78_10825 [bacterium]|nr:hypothetical protein [bacterium]